MTTTVKRVPDMLRGLGLRDDVHDYGGNGGVANGVHQSRHRDQPDHGEWP